MTTSATQPDDPLIGRTVCGCKIIRLIGRGGMGSVYVGRQLSLDRIVAVKVLASALSANEEFLGRFRREARSLANLKHPNIVAIHDFGEEDDIHAVVMEHVDGESVADILERQPILPLPRALNIVRQVAQGLAYAHGHGIIHCDLKPENILVTGEGVAKVIDFGLAKSLRGDALRVTQEGSILGTPNYMSPEQCEGVQLDARSDIYSLGTAFYRMVAGVDAFDAENPLAIMLKHQQEPAPDPRRFNADVPAPLARVILRMMAKKPEDRFQTADDLAAALADEALAEPETKPPLSPRRELALLREALDDELLTVEQARQALADRGDEPLAERLVTQGLLGAEQAEELAEREAGREAARRDQQFARFA
ncbi:MAG: protein kinase domain-containing protein, partial [Planctomycetota bacterium]